MQQFDSYFGVLAHSLMICLSRMLIRLRNSDILFKSSFSYSIIQNFVKSRSITSSCVSEPFESSFLGESSSKSSLNPRQSDLDHILATIRGIRNEDEVFYCLTHDKTCNGIHISNDLIHKLLHKFRDDWKSALGVFRWFESSRGINHSIEACEAMVDILGKARKWDQMKELVEKMQKENLVTLNAVAKIMRRFAGARKWEEAVRIFDELRSLGLEKNTEAMNILLDTLCKEYRVEQARRVFLKLKSHISPDAYTFNIFISGWCKVNRVEEALWTIQEMRGQGFYPSVISYSTIIQHYCSHGDFRKVYELLEEMKTFGCPANVVTYTIIMYSLTVREEFEEALQVAERMRAAGCKPDTLFYNCLIPTLSRLGRLEEASHVFKVEMPETGIKANKSTYYAMISMFCHHRQSQKAFELIREMESSELCQPDAQTYYPLLKLCFKQGNMDGLSALLDEMVNKHHLSLDISTYTLLIHGLCRANKCDWAYELFLEMITRNLKPRHRTCRLLLDEVKHKDMLEAAERIQEFMKNV